MEVEGLRLNPIASKEEPDPQTRRHRIHCKQELIVNSLQRFYSQRDDLSNIVELLKGSGEMSLRLIDWFVTNYSKQFSISYILHGQEFVVYMNYKSQLKAYSKKLFDPFCRRERILFQVPGHEAFLTTVGKLNFFRWAIEKGVLDHIKTHQKVIEKHMNEAMREQTKQRTTQSKKVEKTGTAAEPQEKQEKQLNQTRRRSSMKDTTQTKALQKHDCTIEMRFD
jgi:hypothetical protein